MRRGPAPSLDAPSLCDPPPGREQHREDDAEARVRGERRAEDAEDEEDGDDDTRVPQRRRGTRSARRQTPRGRTSTCFRRRSRPRDTPAQSLHACHGSHPFCPSASRGWSGSRAAAPPVILDSRDAIEPRPPSRETTRAAARANRARRPRWLAVRPDRGRRRASPRPTGALAKGSRRTRGNDTIGDREAGAWRASAAHRHAAEDRGRARLRPRGGAQAPLDVGPSAP